MILDPYRAAAAAPIQYFFGEHLTPLQAVVPGEPPQLANAAFLAAVTAAEAWDFEAEAEVVDTSFPHLFSGNQAGVSVTATSTITNYLEMTSTPTSGRFNTTSGGGIYLNAKDDVTFAFATSISAFGFYGTDFGDFSGQVKATLTNDADVDTTVDIGHSLPANNGALIFWGFAHPGVAYKRVRIFATYGTPPGSGNEDNFGIDDVTIADAL